MIRVAVLLFVAVTAQAQFRQALPGYEFAFPRDHFEHLEFELEWWYYTGNLTADDGRRLGFELTFFRNAVERAGPATSVWDIDQLYLAHFAISDIEGQRFYKVERLNRAGPGLAGADPERALIWNGNWQVAWDGDVQSLRAVSQDAALDLELTPAKRPVINGENGVSQKADGAGKASHYITFTRLDAKGKLQLGGERFSVDGTAWMDHEFSTDSMGANQAGWDWLSMQLDDGADLMLYRLRDADGSTDAHSAGTYVGTDGEAVHLNAEDFTMTPGARWTSPATGGVYPLEWRVTVPKLNLDLTVRTPLQSQEIVPTNGRGPTYWEGAIEAEGENVRGVGYLEMTGYAERLRLGVERQAR